MPALTADDCREACPCTQWRKPFKIQCVTQSECEWVFDGPSRVTVAVHGRYTINSHRMHVEAAEQGLGVARVFPFLAQKAVAAGRLVPVLPDWSSPEGRVHVVTLGANRRTAALEAFLEVLTEVLAEVPASDGR